MCNGPALEAGRRSLLATEEHSYGAYSRATNARRASLNTAPAAEEDRGPPPRRQGAPRRSVSTSMATPEGRLFPVPPSLPRTVPLSLKPARDPGDLRARAQAVRRMPLVLGAAGHVRHCGQGDGKARAMTSVTKA